MTSNMKELFERMEDAEITTLDEVHSFCHNHIPVGMDNPKPELSDLIDIDGYLFDLAEVCIVACIDNLNLYLIQFDNGIKLSIINSEDDSRRRDRLCYPRDMFIKRWKLARFCIT